MWCRRIPINLVFYILKFRRCSIKEFTSAGMRTGELFTLFILLRLLAHLCDGGDLVLRDGPAGHGLVEALEHLVADVHLRHVELVLHAHAHALSCWEKIKLFNIFYVISKLSCYLLFSLTLTTVVSFDERLTRDAALVYLSSKAIKRVSRMVYLP